ncbi:NAD(P)H-hydrate epimerase [Hymenobacter sp. 5516J-16]|nr:NAD(P)H-hydrate epimerase [Hymenobacter sp. 5516J-16]UOQ75701.1 NAD(P)H-hydrate epimerase [Hymenobacter sp. 5516J-16]
MKILTAAQTRQADAATLLAEGITSAELMERAATAFCHWLQERLPAHSQRPMHIFCGPGNNGGDGLAIARQLHEAGYQPQVWTLPAAQPSADFTLNRQRLPAGLPCHEIQPETLPQLPARAVVVDALFGTGLSRPLTGAAATLVKHLNQSEATVVAVDMPSGLLTDAPQSPDSLVVRAHHTVSFELPKLAFLLPQNAEFVGQWEVLPIHLDPAFIHNAPVDIYFVNDNFIRGRLPARSKFSHKGTFGHALLLAGSRGKIGASVLAAKACLRGGVGLLTVRTPAVGYPIMQVAAPEAMALADSATDFVTELPDLKPYAAIGIGPGLGQEHATCEVLRQLLRKAKVPLVLDADALNLLGANPSLLKLLPRESLLTPTPRSLSGWWANPPATITTAWSNYAPLCGSMGATAC